MNHDLPRILTLLRKERGLSQKEVAAELGISQALLSHYENGKRECGLDVLVRAADLYRVSCDYLLGRTVERTGATLVLTDLPAKSQALNEDSRDVILGKRLVMNSLSVLFDLLMQMGNAELTDATVSMLMISVYRVLRILHYTNRQNPKTMFSLPSHDYCAKASGYTAVCEANAIHLARQPRPDAERSGVAISPEKLSESFPMYAPSLLNVTRMVEERIGKAFPSQN